ncbi:MAG TPA: heavy metal translocating P-type ATPase metal-binding domain-containing protein, partial [Bacillota bacterium]|nr:heavy metal translocating P-type ATPase metal-binding domain-containing protein [Bacillota bacterium]
MPEPGVAALALESLGQSARQPLPAAEQGACFHCGEPCPNSTFTQAEKTFCCQGCLVVHDLLTESGLEQFYDLSRHPGVRGRSSVKREQWAYLDAPSVQPRLLDFTDGKISRITFHVPAIHCVACVWLLENLFRLHVGVGKSQVNFPRREVAISFASQKIALSELVALLASIGYEPQLTLGELEKQRPNAARKRQWLQVGIAGFAFGNIMLFSLPTYLGLDSFSGPLFQALFGYLSLALALPVLCYSASDYWRSALVSLRQRVLTLDVPIALGLAALYAQSVFEVISGHGEGYLDSLAGLIFFLLCGRVFQQKTHERMAFDRDYKCFFPLATLRKTAAGEESVAISDLRVGDRLLLRHGELIPADATLVSGPACIDYSFVTGESEPVGKQPGDYLYAGGQQVDGTIEVETVKPVSQSYLTSLWNHEAFQKPRHDTLNTLTNRYSRRFTRIVIAVAVGAALYWILAGNAVRGLKAFTSVLIVACPCALALAAPFALGMAQRLLARLQVFLRNALVLERLAQVDAIVFDKTGTLTVARANEVSFVACEGCKGRAGSPLPAAGCQPTRTQRQVDAALTLSAAEGTWVYALARQSTHPHSARIAEWLANPNRPEAVSTFKETPGCGIAGRVQGHEIRLGSRAWLWQCGVPMPEQTLPAGSAVYLVIDGQCRGAFVLANALRPEADKLLRNLGQHYELALLSGDNERERERFRGLFGSQARLDFNQSPLDKLGFIRTLQASGKTVMMVGDGLNDAGALSQSDVGVAVVEKVGAFSPASDIILEAGQVTQVGNILAMARQTTRVVRLSFGISALYNLVGISIAAAGILSPVVCAILMPLSSVSVV